MELAGRSIRSEIVKRTVKEIRGKDQQDKKS